MGEMQVQGKPSLTVPDNFDGTVAVGNGPRILRWVVDGGVPGLLSWIFSVASISAIGEGDYSRASSLSTAQLVVGIGWVLVLVVMLGTRGQTPGLMVAGIRWVKYPSGATGGGSAIGKYLLEGVISTISLGIAPLIIWFASQDQANRHWFDRTCGLISVSTRLGREPSSTVVPVSSAPLTPAPAPQPWEAASQPAAQVGPGASPQPPTGMPPVPLPGSSSGGHTPVQTAGVPTVGGMPPVPMPGPVPAPPTQAVTPEPARQEPTGFIGEVPWSAPTSSPSPAPQASSAPAPADASFRPTIPPVPVPSPVAPRPEVEPSGPTSSAWAAPGPDDDLERTVARRPAGSVMLGFDDGTHHHLVGSAVLGRDPAADAAHPSAELVPVHDPERSISKTHLALTVQSGAVLVEDLHSTNGTSVSNPDGTTVTVLPGASVLAAPGAVVHFGNRTVSIGG